MDMDIDLDELERLAKAATPGPWKYRLVGRQANIIMADTEPLCATKYSHNKSHDAAYIVAACNALPKLIARVRELERQNSFFLKVLGESSMCPYPHCMYDCDGSELQEWDCTAVDNKDCWIQAAREDGE